MLGNHFQLLKSTGTNQFAGGGDWIRTSVGVSQQIYSLPPLATRAPLQKQDSNYAIFLQSIARSHQSFSPIDGFLTQTGQKIIGLGEMTTP